MLIGFGGPERPEDVRPFLESVLQGIRIPQERFDEVLHHYEVIGGVSPYNAITYRQKAALEKELSGRGRNIPVVAGFRHSTPSFKDAVLEIKKNGRTRAVGFILAGLRSYPSFEKYIEKLDLAQSEAGGEPVSFTYTDPFHDHPFFISAQADEVLKACAALESQEKENAYYIFSAHSIPVAMAEKSGYGKQFQETSRLIAEKLNLKHWQTAYQSRSGSPRDPWLEPDVQSVIGKIDPAVFKTVVLVPAGFLCDNVEVIYDLDTEARQTAEARGLRYLRAKTVTDHPQFIRLVADLIEKKLNALSL